MDTLPKDVYALPTYPNPRLVIAFVGAIGTELHLAEELFVGLLKQYKYEAEIIKISDHFKDFDPGYKDDHESSDVFTRYDKAMDQGDLIRRKLNVNDAVAQKAISLICEKEKILAASCSLERERKAYIIHSIKKPEEVHAFRSVYNELFYCIAIHAHYEKRLNRMINKAMSRDANLTRTEATERMEKLLKRDEHDEDKEKDGQKYGQNVRHAFEKADYYIGSDENGQLAEELERFVDLIFDVPFISPTIQETAMVHAYMSGLRSADLSRQVGAAIVGRDGAILTTGCNEVPRAGGGQYRNGDIDDARDFRLGYDTNDRLKIATIIEMLKAIASEPLVNNPEQKETNAVTNTTTSSSIMKKSQAEENSQEDQGKKPFLSTINFPSLQKSDDAYSENYDFYKNHLEAHLKGTRIDSILEFSRVVHAEMAAIDEATMKNVSIRDADLYCMTFPCHLCARLIINTGIRNVFYIEPYPKSLTKDLFKRESEVNPDMSNGYLKERLLSSYPMPLKVAFIPFTGVAPRRYGALFGETKRRKRENGDVKPRSTIMSPRRAPIMPFHAQVEKDIYENINKAQMDFKSLPD